MGGDIQVRTASKKPKHVGFLLMERFTLISLSSAIDPLRVANQLSGHTLYTWALVGSSPDTQVSSDGIRVALDAPLKSVDAFDIVIVVGGVDIQNVPQKAECQWLKKLARADVVLGAVCTGSYVLANAGLLDGYQCSAHWDCLTLLNEHFPNVYCNNQLYTIDRKRMTCTGGTVPLHMMLGMLAANHSQALVDAVADMLVCDRHRADSELQLVPMWSRKVQVQPKLNEVLELMEANLEEPISLQELADFVHLSRRQLERMFLKSLHCTPSRYYLKLRLDRARRLLKQSTRSIVEITAMCGFVSTTHFSRCYRKYMGVSPRSDRASGSTEVYLSEESELLG
jgi:transcriptional regulator GlxA family with amidase domain